MAVAPRCAGVVQRCPSDGRRYHRAIDQNHPQRTWRPGRCSAEIRSARHGELAAILEVWRTAGAQPTTTDDLGSLEVFFQRSPHLTLVAVDEGAVVGTLLAAWDGWRGGYHRLAVVPWCRRRGIARALVHEGEDRLAALGARRVALFTVPGDPGAVEFWEALGYRANPDRLRLAKTLS